MWRLTRAHERPTRGQRNEDRRRKKRERERVARGGREKDVCVRARIGDEDEPNAKLKKKRDMLRYTNTYTRSSVSVYRGDVSVCATVTVNVCREAYPPVERGADESVELSAHPTPNPPETNPSYRDEPPPHYSSLAFPSSTADPLLHASLSFSRPFFAPRCAVTPVRRNNASKEKWEKRA